MPVLTRLPTTFLAVALLTGACTSAPQSTDVDPERPWLVDPRNVTSADRLIEAAHAAYEAGEYFSAADFYQRAKFLRRMEKRVDDEPLMGLGRSMMAVGGYTEAAEAFREVVRLKGRYHGARVELGFALLALGQPLAAKEHLLVALELGPSVRVYNGLGVAHDMIKDHQSAQKFYRSGIELDPDDSHLRNNLSLSLALSGDTQAAIAQLGHKVQGPDATLREKLALALAHALGGDVRAASGAVPFDIDYHGAKLRKGQARSLQTMRAVWVDDGIVREAASGERSAEVGGAPRDPGKLANADPAPIPAAAGAEEPSGEVLVAEAAVETAPHNDGDAAPPAMPLPAAPVVPVPLAVAPTPAQKLPAPSEPAIHETPAHADSQAGAVSAEMSGAEAPADALPNTNPPNAEMPPPPALGPPGDMPPPVMAGEAPPVVVAPPPAAEPAKITRAAPNDVAGNPHGGQNVLAPYAGDGPSSPPASAAGGTPLAGSSGSGAVLAPYGETPLAPPAQLPAATGTVLQPYRAAPPAALTSPVVLSPYHSAVPASPPPPAALGIGKTPMKGGFQVQVGSFREQGRAERRWAQLLNTAPDLFNGVVPSVEEAEVGRAGNKYYRLRTSPFGDRASASSFCGKLKARSITCIVVTAKPAR